MKKLLTLLFVFLLLSLCACGVLINEADKTSTSSLPASSNEISSNPSKISEEDAIEIASKYWGIKSGDIDEKTGFSFLIMPVESPNENIKIALKWFVNNHHYSALDMIEINPFTGEIVNGVAEE